MTCRSMQKRQTRTVEATSRPAAIEALRAQLRAENGSQFLAQHTVDVLAVYTVSAGRVYEVDVEITDKVWAPSHDHLLVA